MREIVTFLLTDVEGSTRAWQDRPDETSAAIERLESIARESASARGGRVVKSRGEGDSMFCVFAAPSDAIAAAVELQRAALDLPVKVRIAVHTGEAELRDGDWYGVAPARAARLRSLATGGQILCSSATAALSTSLPDGVTLRDLGAVRLPSFADREHVHQACYADLPDAFPPLRRETALPASLTSFVGRAEQVAELSAFLSRARLVTLTGAGGSGKSRLAVETARGALGFPGGAWLVELAPIADPEAVVATVSSTVGASSVSIDAIAGRLGEERALVVLDNCEHLVEAVADLAVALLGVCPSLVVLATSREPLGVAGESVWAVAPLGVPRRGKTDGPAVELFVDRATAARHDFAINDRNAEAIADICRRLDGIPLALELAASRVSLLSVEQIARGLDDRFRLLTAGGRTALSRQRTLEASVAWSFDLLSEPERIVLRRLAVFVGTFSLEGAQAVCGGGDVLDLLGRLVHRSLVTPDEIGGLVRYRLLDTIRFYALARLTESGELDGTLDRHLAYYRSVSVGISEDFWGADQAGALGLFSAEADNLRAAFDRAMPDPEATLAVGIGMISCLNFTGPTSEARDRARTLLALDVPPDAKVELLMQLSTARVSLGEFAEAIAAWGEARPLLSEVTDPRVSWHAAAVRAMLMTTLTSVERGRDLFADAHSAALRAGGFAPVMSEYLCGWAEAFSGDLAAAARALDSAREGSRRGGFVPLEFAALEIRAVAALGQGDVVLAQTTATEGLVLGDGLGPALGWMGAHSIGSAGLLVGDLETARGWLRRLDSPELSVQGRIVGTCFKASIALWEGSSDALEHARAGARLLGTAARNTWHPVWMLDLVEAEVAMGDPALASRAIDAMQEVAEPRGQRHAAGVARLGRARLHRAAGDPAAAVSEARRALADLEWAHAWLAAMFGLATLGGALADPGDAKNGARMLAASDAARVSMGIVRPPWDQRQFEADVQACGGLPDRAAMALEDAVGWAAFSS